MRQARSTVNLTHPVIRITQQTADAAVHAMMVMSAAILRTVGVFQAGASSVAVNATARVGARLNGIVARFAKFDAVLPPGRISRNPKSARRVK